MSLTKTEEAVSGRWFLEVVLQNLRTLVLGGFTIHANSILPGLAQDFIVFIANMGLSQSNLNPTHVAGHNLNLVFATEKIGKDSVLEG